MDCFITCIKEATTVCAQDAKELIGKEATQANGVCVCKDISATDIAKLSYRCQSATRVAILLSSGKVDVLNQDSVDEFIQKTITKDLLNEYFENVQSFAVEVQKEADLNYSSTDLAASFGDAFGKVLEANNFDFAVNLTSPQRKVLVHITQEEVFVGIDIIGFSLIKRPYKIFIHPSALNGVLAYSMARLGGVKKDSVVLDPFCGSGTIPIEISLMQNEQSCFHFENKFAGLRIPQLSEAFEEVASKLKKKKGTKKDLVFGFDHLLRLTKGAQKNAKIAGVIDTVNFSKVSLDWIDAKFNEKSVDCIVTNPPAISKRTGNQREVLKLFDELFYQARYLLKPKGKITIILITPSSIIDIAAKHEFIVEQELTIHGGKLPFQLYTFKRK